MTEFTHGVKLDLFTLGLKEYSIDYTHNGNMQ